MQKKLEYPPPPPPWAGNCKYLSCNIYVTARKDVTIAKLMLWVRTMHFLTQATKQYIKHTSNFCYHAIGSKPYPKYQKLPDEALM